MRLHEETISRERVFDGRLLKVYRDRVRLVDGDTSLREWIDHPGASAVVPLFEDGTTILLRQFRYPPRREFLEVPAGKLDGPEDAPVEAARRELSEETGWRAGRLISLGATYPCIGYSNERIHFFLALDLEPGSLQPEEGEFLVPMRLPFEEACSMARAGELLDMKTVAALFFAENWLRRNEA